MHYSFYYIGKSTLFILISAKYGKLGRAAALFSLFYVIFELLFFYSIQGKRQYVHFYSFCIGKKTIFNKIQLNFDCNYCSIQFDKGEKGNKSVKKCIKIAKRANKINKCRAVPILLYTNLHYSILIYTILLYLIYIYYDISLYLLYIFGYKNSRKPHKSGVFWLFQRFFLPSPTII